MKLTQEQIRRLPTLFELVRKLDAEEKELLSDMGGWENCQDPFDKILPLDDYKSMHNDFYNEAASNHFIAIRTKSGRTVFKPNLRDHLFLYRGQNKHYDRIVSSFERRDAKWDDETALDHKLFHNLKAEEFVNLLRTHPIFMMFDRGVILEPVKAPFYIDMNYYGLCQHYGFRTGVIDFTTDLNVAAFFASARYRGNDAYELYDNTGYGVIYRHRIRPNATFKAIGFSTIGMQLYPRSGAQKGVLWNEGLSRFPVDNCVEAYLFRHDYHADKHFFDLDEWVKFQRYLYYCQNSAIRNAKMRGDA